MQKRLCSTTWLVPSIRWWSSPLHTKYLNKRLYQNVYTVNTSYKLEPYISRVWGFWAYLFVFCYYFLFFDTFWFKFGSGTPPNVSRTINSTGFWPSFVQFRQIFTIFDHFLDRIFVQKWGCWAYDFWSIGPRVSELKVKACDGVFTVLVVETKSVDKKRRTPSC